MKTKNYGMRVDTRTGNILAMEFFEPKKNPYTKRKEVILYFITLDREDVDKDFTDYSDLTLENHTEYLWHKFYSDVKGLGELDEFDFDSRKQELENAGHKPIKYITSKDSLENIVEFLEEENVLNKIEIQSIVKQIFEPRYTII